MSQHQLESLCTARADLTLGLAPSLSLGLELRLELGYVNLLVLQVV